MPPALLMPLALAAAGGASAGAQIYNAKKTGETNRRALEQADRSQERDLAFERDNMARKERTWTAYMDADKQRWNDYMRANQPFLSGQQGLLNSLAGLAGYSGQMPAMGTGGGPASAGVPMPVASPGHASAARRTNPALPAPGGSDPLGSLLALAQVASMAGQGQPGGPMTGIGNTAAPPGVDPTRYTRPVELYR